MIDPRTRLVLVACVGVLAVTLERPVALLILAVACALAVAPRLERRWWLRGTALVAGVVWGTALSQALFYAEHPRVALVELGPLVLWREGLVHGLAQSLRLVAVSLAGIALALSTPPATLLAALRRLRVPFGLALMVATALRFLPDIGREVATVRAARAHRGRPTWKRAPWAWLALEVSMLQPVVARSWRRAQSLAESLDARGFDPVAPRTERTPLALGWRDAVALPVIAGTVGIVLARGAFWLYAAELVYVPGWRPLYGFVRAWL